MGQTQIWQRRRPEANHVKVRTACQVASPPLHLFVFQALCHFLVDSVAWLFIVPIKDPSQLRAHWDGTACAPRRKFKFEWIIILTSSSYSSVTNSTSHPAASVLMDLEITFAQINVFKIQMTDCRKNTIYNLLENGVSVWYFPSFSRRVFVSDLILGFCTYFHKLAHFIFKE